MYKEKAWQVFMTEILIGFANSCVPMLRTVTPPL